jgi:hypothetical protein
MMEANQITKKLLDFQKGAISQWFDVVTSIQDRTASSLTMAMDQSLWMPDKGRQMVESWVSACKKGCHDYKELVEGSISGLEKVLIIPSTKVEASKKSATKRTTPSAKPKVAAKEEVTAAADISDIKAQPIEKSDDSSKETAIDMTAETNKPVK